MEISISTSRDTMVSYTWQTGVAVNESVLCGERGLVKDPNVPGVTASYNSSTGYLTFVGTPTTAGTYSGRFAEPYLPNANQSINITVEEYTPPVTYYTITASSGSGGSISPSGSISVEAVMV